MQSFGSNFPAFMTQINLRSRCKTSEKINEDVTANIPFLLKHPSLAVTHQLANLQLITFGNRTE